MVKDYVIRLFCFQPIALQRGYLYDSFLDIHLEALSLFAKHRSLLIAVWDWLDCFVALQAARRSSRRSSHLTVWPAFSSYCCAFLILSLVGRLARCWGMSRGGGGVGFGVRGRGTALSCRLRPRKAPHSCAPTLKSARDSAGAAGAADWSF